MESIPLDENSQWQNVLSYQAIVSSFDVKGFKDLSLNVAIVFKGVFKIFIKKSFSQTIDKRKETKMPVKFSVPTSRSNCLIVYYKQLTIRSHWHIFN